MAKIIELCGVPGVGKTTTYSELKSVWNKHHKWIPAEFLYPRKKVELKNPKTVFYTLSQRVRGILEHSEVKAAGERFVIENPKYLDSTWNAIHRKHMERGSTPDNRFEEARRLQRSAEFIQLLIENETQKFAIIDIGGLVQRLDLTWYTSKDFREDEKEAIHLLDLMPLPAAVVYISIDLEKNVERLLGRNKTLKIHRNMSARELQEYCKKYRQRWEMICGLLTEKNIPVLRIDSNVDKKKNVKAIDEFVEKLSTDTYLSADNTKRQTVLAAR